ncbi:hypothetical protein [Streptococcus agalactiae]|uniref:hypothetical protein n=2 Tax=Streptococcus agalactiae TaxID=1311 RepID=UPI0002BAD31B|nr:hypothetical protein [Streptococcus agalactiae]EPT90724.1 hypothetical protein SAG0104_05000 [Streptococcus agalactiae BSU178]KLJ84244.1 hypothetical protein WB01_07670 [Streptococcus agalactiae]CNB34213.1 Uncharacterised protein [Streptococcus agalactiae]CNC17886.1 Uncharacterised protein [Streptococcus agalactiae]CND71948.1 Uncharacterised protein [Streptococcus agalactiae]
MSNMINLNLDNNIIPVNFGAFTLDYRASDTKEVEMVNKAKELKEKANKLDALEKQVEKDESKEFELRSGIKEILDDVFNTMFDNADAPKKIYAACGENTWTYLNAFLQVGDNLVEIKEKKANDETFQKYLAK